MPGTPQAPSARREELLERAYRYALTHGLADLSLRPLAAAIGSSPRVLLFLFGNKDGLIRALLGRARSDEMALLERLRSTTSDKTNTGPNGRTGAGLGTVAIELWRWLSAAEHRALLTVWAEAYTRSLTQPHGPWANFARSTVEDWVGLLTSTQPEPERHTSAGQIRQTLTLAVLRGALLDLLATGDIDRTTRAVQHYASTHLGEAS